MIPKVIHYCWFGGNSLPDLAKKCIKSWKKHCPDYQIIQWNESNYDLTQAPLYVRQAYAAKKWAFVADYVRLQVVYEHGGIYMDTDVELKKSLDKLLSHQAFLGFEDGSLINTGLGFGAVKGTTILQEMMADYQYIPFLKPDGTYDTETCPRRNTKILLQHGLKQDDSMQILEGDILILPSIYLCPLSYETQEYHRSSETMSVHWFDASWRTEEEKKYHKDKLRRERLDKLIHLPNRILLKILGDSGYQELKRLLGRRN